MARPKVDIRYRERVAILAERGLRPPTITRIIQEDAEKEGLGDYPSVRSVRRIYKEHDDKTPEERRQYATFRWPDSVEEAGVPWEGSRVILDWIAWLDQNSLTRPTISRVKWYWRVHLAAPSLDQRQTALAAGWLSKMELYEGDETSKAIANVIELFLVHQPWQWAWDELEKDPTFLRVLLRLGGIEGQWKQGTPPPKEVLHLRRFAEMVLRELGLFPEGYDPDEIPEGILPRPGRPG